MNILPFSLPILSHEKGFYSSNCKGLRGFYLGFLIRVFQQTQRSVTPKAIEQVEEALTGKNEAQPTSDESDWAKVYKEVLRGEREVLVSTVNDNSVRTKLQPENTNFNLLDFDGNGIPELVINSKMSYWDEKISESYQPIINLTNWVNAYVYTVRNGELLPLFLANDQMSSSVNFHYIGFTDNGYKLYSELNMLFTGDFRTHELIGNEMRITDKTGFSADSERPTIFRNNDVEVRASVYNDKKFEYHNGSYDFESYPVNEENLKAVIDAYPAKIQKKPSQDWRGAYRNLLIEGHGILRIADDIVNGFNSVYPPYNHGVSSGYYNNRWMNQNDIERIGVVDINGDGIKELILLSHSPHFNNPNAKDLIIYTYDKGFKNAKLMMIWATETLSIRKSGFLADSKQIIIDRSANGILNYTILNILDKVVQLHKYYDGHINMHDSNYSYTNVIENTYLIDSDNLIKTSIKDRVIEGAIENNLKSMTTFESVLLPMTLENINQILK